MSTHHCDVQFTTFYFIVFCACHVYKTTFLTINLTAWKNLSLKVQLFSVIMRWSGRIGSKIWRVGTSGVAKTDICELARSPALSRSRRAAPLRARIGARGYTHRWASDSETACDELAGTVSRRDDWWTQKDGTDRRTDASAAEACRCLGLRDCLQRDEPPCSVRHAPLYRIIIAL